MFMNKGHKNQWSGGQRGCLGRRGHAQLVNLDQQGELSYSTDGWGSLHGKRVNSSISKLLTCFIYIVVVDYINLY